MKLAELFKRGVTQIVALGGTTTSSGESAGLMIISDIGPITQSRNRNKADVTTREKVTWDAAANIREITVTITVIGAQTTDTHQDVCLGIAFNAGSDAIADAWLTETDTEADDVQYELVKLGETKTFRFTSALTRADFLRIDGADNLRVHIGAH